MKSVLGVSLLALSLLGAAASQPASAQTGGTSAAGSFRFSLDDGLTKSVEFSARTADGVTTGGMTLEDRVGVSERDVDGVAAPRADDSPLSLYIKAEFDCLLVEKNRAVMCGTVRESNLKSYVGRRVMLMVEDNGDDPRTPDRVFWGVYKPEGGWVPVDAERPDDKGASLSWTATDAERKDDVGVPSRKSAVVNCQSFSPQAYIMQAGEGSIQIRP